MKNNSDNDNRKVLSILSHASILLSSTVISVGVPIAILLVSKDTVVKKNAKEALNFYITFYIFATLLSILPFLFLGLRLSSVLKTVIPLFILFLIATLVMPIIAIVKVLENPDRSYRYPLIWHPL